MNLFQNQFPNSKSPPKFQLIEIIVKFVLKFGPIFHHQLLTFLSSARKFYNEKLLLENATKGPSYLQSPNIFSTFSL